jgi:hypothetical protein
MFIYKFWFLNKIKIWCVEDMIRRTRWFPLNPLVSPKFSLSAVSEFADVVKEFRKKKIKNETIRSEYNINAFERLLIETEIKRHREKKKKKVEEIS